MNKKAIIRNYILSLILVVVFIVIMSMFIIDFSKKTEQGTQKDICKNSIYMHSSGKIGLSDLDLDIKCPTQELEIKTKDPEKIKYRMAKAMYDCWDQFGKGELELFGAEETIYCNVCHIISFDEKDEEITGFPEYLATKYIPGKPGTSYLEFFMNYETDDPSNVIPEMDETQTTTYEGGAVIDTSKTYATIFAYAKGEDEIQKIKDALTVQHIDGTAPLIVAGVAGATGIAILIIVSASNPIGWVLIGVGLLVYGIVAAIDSFFDDNPVEWASFILLREYNQASLEDIGCKYIPLS